MDVIRLASNSHSNVLGVMFMRTYAFTERYRLVLAVLLTCYAALMAVEIYCFAVKVIVPEEIFELLGKTGCFYDSSSKLLKYRLAVRK